MVEERDTWVEDYETNVRFHDGDLQLTIFLLVCFST